MKPEVRVAADAREFFTPELCWILEVANDAGDEAVSISRARVEPGITTKWHYLRDIVERYVIAAGEGAVEIGGLGPSRVVAGDVVRIPSGARQRITNTGPDQLVFFCVCTPRFRPECYVPIET